jgi:hypothetical protein
MPASEVMHKWKTGKMWIDVISKPHIFLCDGWNGPRWSYIPAKRVAYNVGINAAANAFCITLNHRQFGEGLF